MPSSQLLAPLLPPPPPSQERQRQQQQLPSQSQSQPHPQPHTHTHSHSDHHTHEAQQHSPNVRHQGAQQQEPTARPALPHRDVTSDTLEDAYVQFIFYCNPALPPTSDSDSLREAFRNPPRSGGKIFNPFSVYELVRKFYSKEIKTWTELTTRLGVEPPDPSKDESAQKIAQYGVRLKKWMNSMHVKAFFEYLMDIPNEYWNNVPTDSDPLAQHVRDGIAVEDDMALRALLPHIRPKRGRKRPEGEDYINSPAQRRRLSPLSAIDGRTAPWSAHPDTARPVPIHWNAVDALHMKWPNSAITPTSKSSFWDDALEPRSAVTPSKLKLSGHRRGAKNVSSAWKPGGSDSGAKTRGRPPINRTTVDPPMTSWAPTPESNPAEAVTHGETTQTSQSPNQSRPPIPAGAGFAPIPTPPPAPMTSGYEGLRPARPNISLLVPERQGGSVRLATPPPPPPAVLLNNQHESANNKDQKGPSQQSKSVGLDRFTRETKEACESTGMSAPQADGASSASSSDRGDVSGFYFETLEDRTNVDSILSYFTHVLHNADWTDAEGKPQERADVVECTAMANVTLQHMYKTAASSQAFLINLAALAGARMLMANRPKCYRCATDEESNTYQFEWQYRFGHLKGQFTMSHTVPHTMWKKMPLTGAGEKPQTQNGEQEIPRPASPLTVEQWQSKYDALVKELEQRDQDMMDIQRNVMASLKGPWMKP